MAYLARRLVASSIPNYMNVIRLLHLQAGFSNPLEDNFEVGLIRKGINREKGVPPLQKKPITLAILRKIHTCLDLSKPSELSFWAACLIGFMGFLRKSSLLPASGPFNPAKTLLRGDVKELSLESFVLIVKHSKVIQFGQKVHEIPYARCTEFRLCPVRALHAHLGASVLPPGRPLFSYNLAGLEHTMSQLDFVNRLRNLLKTIGLGAGDYSAHSLRRGGASLAFELGVTPLQIKLRGDWSSSAFERYVFVSSGATMRIAVAMSAGIVNKVS